MYLSSLSILNFKNIREANLSFSSKLNCFVGQNGQGKTNLLDAIYYLSFTKSFFNAIDSQNITHGEELALIQGDYKGDEDIQLSCGLKRGQKKQFKRGKKDYKRLLEHIGLLPLVMVSPADSELIAEGSEERRRFVDGVISQTNRTYLERLTSYNTLLKQRNALLKQGEEHPELVPDELLEVLEEQLTPLAEYIYSERTTFIEAFLPYFQEIYHEIAGDNEQVVLRYVSQLQDRDLREAYRRTRSRDFALGWTSQGIHKDELEMLLRHGDEDAYPLKRVGSQGQQKTFLLAMKLAEALYLTQHIRKPILLLDDIFDKLDTERVERIVTLVKSDRFGQIFLTDTDRQHLTDILSPDNDSIFHVIGGVITRNN